MKNIRRVVLFVTLLIVPVIYGVPGCTTGGGDNDGKPTPTPCPTVVFSDGGTGHVCR